MLSDQDLTNFFIKISKTCEAVICCRVSPSQKAEVIKLIKQDDPDMITLAVGDGANDVSMIKEAHIGVGLYGNEGLRAVQSSDIALGEFKFLWRLLLHHGRLSYMRNSEMVLYFFYKNNLLSFPHFLFAFSSAFSGQTICDDMYITFFNMAFTFWPLFVRAVQDLDVDYQIDGKQFKPFIPRLYYLGQEKVLLNKPQFLFWQITGTF